MGSEHSTLRLRGTSLIAAIAVAGCWHLGAPGGGEAPDGGAGDVDSDVDGDADGDGDTDSDGDSVPTFEGFFITDVSGNGPDDIWVVTDGGYALHFDGEEWTAEKVGDLPLRAVWAVAPDFVLAVSGTLWTEDPPAGDEEAVIYRYDGASWHVELESPGVALTGVWGTGPGFALACGYRSSEQGVVFGIDGEEWTEVAEGFDPLVAIHGSSATDVWMVGSDSSAYHFDGDGWTEEQLIYSDSIFTAVWSAGPNAAYAVGDHGRVNFHDGLGWNLIEPTTSMSGDDLKDVWGFGPEDVFVLGYDTYTVDGGPGWSLFHWDGPEWAFLGIIGDMFPIALWGSSAADLYIATDGELVHYDGTDFEVVLIALP